MTLLIRDAGPADADAIAALHLDVWRRTYSDLAPAAAFQALDLAVRQRTWRGLLADLGYRGIGLGVVVGNDPALAFYRALGGRVIGRYVDPGPLWRSENLLCAWDDASVLARQA